MKHKYAIILYFVIFLSLGAILILNNEMNISERETVVTYSFPSDENVTNIVSDKCTTITSTFASKSTKSKNTTVITTILTENAPLFIDVNKASHDELSKLNGIGDKLADAIIRYRDENGRFNNIEEILNVYGIGDNLFESIKNYIYVENPVYSDSYEDNKEIEDESVDLNEENPNIEEDIQSETVLSDETEPIISLDDVAPIDLNTADIDLLMLLPHVDEEIAEKIINLREKIHVFSHPYELLYIEELSQQQVAEIIEYISIDNGDENDN